MMDLRPSCGREECRRRIFHIIDAHGPIRAEDLVNEMIRRGWAYPDLTPEDIGLAADDIIMRRLHG